MRSGTVADWGSGDSVAEEGSCVWEDLVGCVETSLSEPSKAADAVIKAVLKGAFHWLIDAAGAVLFAFSLSKEQPSHTHRNTRQHTRCTKRSTGNSALCFGFFSSLTSFISVSLFLIFNYFKNIIILLSGVLLLIQRMSILDIICYFSLIILPAIFFITVTELTVALLSPVKFAICNLLILNFKQIWGRNRYFFFLNV